MFNPWLKSQGKAVQFPSEPAQHNSVHHCKFDMFQVLIKREERSYWVKFYGVRNKFELDWKSLAERGSYTRITFFYKTGMLIKSESKKGDFLRERAARICCCGIRVSETNYQIGEATLGSPESSNKTTLISVRSYSLPFRKSVLGYLRYILKVVEPV